MEEYTDMKSENNNRIVARNYSIIDLINSMEESSNPILLSLVLYH